MKRSFSLAAALLLVCTAAFGQHDHDKKPAAPPFDPAMMEAMIKAGTPGEPHKKLDGMVGTWSAKISSWMAPGTDPMVMDGTATTKWVMGGRYLEERFTGSFMGMPFEGLGYTGYDNVKKQYWTSWMDNMSTAIFMSTGSAGDGKTMTFTGTMADPMTGKDMTMETRVTVTDADRHTTEMWAPAPDGKNFKMMEMVYTRKK